MFFLFFYIFCANFSIILCYTNDCLFLTIPTHLHIFGNLFSKTIEVNFMMPLHLHMAVNSMQTMFFLPHYFYILILKSQSPVEIKFLKILRELFLILEGANTIITSATAVSVKMVFLMPHSVFYGKNLGQKFSVKNLP